jgi:heme-degrading monooxygenase HmoA
MYIAMNRFKVKKGSEKAFEDIWLNRTSYLDQMPGFMEFLLLKGAEAEDHVLYSSHTTWKTKDDFEGWTKSDQFRTAHAKANNNSNAGSLYLEHPKFEGFEVMRVESNRKAA